MQARAFPLKPQEARAISSSTVFLLWCELGLEPLGSLLCSCKDLPDQSDILDELYVTLESHEHRGDEFITSDWF